MDESYPGSGYSLKAPGAEPAGTAYRLPSRDEDLHVDDHCTDIDFRTEEKVGGRGAVDACDDLEILGRWLGRANLAAVQSKGV